MKDMNLYDFVINDSEAFQKWKELLNELFENHDIPVPVTDIMASLILKVFSQSIKTFTDNQEKQNYDNTNNNINTDPPTNTPNKCPTT